MLSERMFEKLPKLLKVLYRLNQFTPDIYPNIQDPYYLSNEKLFVWIDSTAYYFNLNTDLTVKGWGFRNNAGPRDHKWHILLTIISAIINNKKESINLYGITFKYYHTDFLTNYVTKRNKKALRIILREFGLNELTINSYLRNKDIDRFRQKRKKINRTRKKDFNHIKPISEILAKAWSLDHLYIVDNIIELFGRYVI